MTVTETQLIPLVTLRMSTGRILDTGTVASTFPVDVELGYTPRYVKVLNLAATGGYIEWFEGMADAAGFKYLSADGAGAAIASLGITPTATGFKIGLDTDIVVTSEQVQWIAFG